MPTSPPTPTTADWTAPVELVALIRPGVKIRVFYTATNRNNHTIHVRALIDDVVITRTWSRHKQRWYYECQDWYFLWLLWKNGFLTDGGKSRAD